MFTFSPFENISYQISKKNGCRRIVQDHNMLPDPVAPINRRWMLTLNDAHAARELPQKARDRAKSACRYAEIRREHARRHG